MNRIETKVLTAVIGVFGSLSLYYVKDISSNLKELNINMATVIERSSNLEKRVDKIEKILGK